MTAADRARGLWIAVLLTAMVPFALPTPLPLHERRLAMPQARAEIDRWAPVVAPLGVSEEEGIAALRSAIRAWRRALGMARAPLRPLLGAMGIDQRWALFAHGIVAVFALPVGCYRPNGPYPGVVVPPLEIGIDTAGADDSGPTETPWAPSTPTPMDTGAYEVVDQPGSIEPSNWTLDVASSVWNNDAVGTLIGVSNVVDHDGDGVEELFVPTSTWYGDLPGGFNLTVPSLPGEHAFSEALAFLDYYTYGSETEFGDQNGDGMTDLVATGIDSELDLGGGRELVVLNGPFDPTSTLLEPDAIAYDVDWQDNPRHPVWGDVTGDGLDDLLLNDGYDLRFVPSPISGTIGEQQVAGAFSAGNEDRFIIYEDEIVSELDGDGVGDVLVHLFDSNDAATDLLWLMAGPLRVASVLEEDGLQVGGRRFGPSLSWPLIDGDLNGDGYSDILQLNQHPWKVDIGYFVFTWAYGPFDGDDHGGGDLLSGLEDGVRTIGWDPGSSVAWDVGDVDADGAGDLVMVGEDPITGLVNHYVVTGLPPAPTIIEDSYRIEVSGFVSPDGNISMNLLADWGGDGGEEIAVLELGVASGAGGFGTVAFLMSEDIAW